MLKFKINFLVDKKKQQTLNSEKGSLTSILNDIKTNESKLSVIVTNKEIINKKKAILVENLDKYKNLDKTKIQIDLVDFNGESLNINSKGDLTANLYLLDKHVYELNTINKSNLLL